MHILLLSTSHHNSSLIVQSALSRSYTVTMLLPLGSYVPNIANVTLVTGSPTCQHHLEAALQTPKSPQAIIIAFDDASIWDSVTRALVNAIKAVHLRTRTECKAPCSIMSLPLRLVFTHSSVKQMRRDYFNKADTIVQESTLPFVLVQCQPRQDTTNSIRASPCDGRGLAWMAAVKRANMAKTPSLTDTSLSLEVTVSETQ
ncbi:uncharacterized protein FIESC28_10866 [Fusarium coffeatum]|uniref:Uncharacterized protein n=1 Tax=Fusarium coffeatum TaxID=231269 RepID=A0A366QSL3_9HYPO|nr:uncharacterized protein FIESC28_10866 [Fusarium coffeatum]RBR06955.1 hypothetical protein FIESC28_10866 [Fusarium coffeatum]